MRLQLCQVSAHILNLQVYSETKRVGSSQCSCFLAVMFASCYLSMAVMFDEYYWKFNCVEMT